MSFEMLPIEAYRIDLSKVEDVDRERLKVTFENGYELFFGVDLRHIVPGLLLDVEQGSARLLVKQMSEFFFYERVLRTRVQRLQDWRRKLVKPSYKWSFNGWTMEKVVENLEIELVIGDEDYSSPLCVGRSLQVIYGTYYSNPCKAFVGWGKVVALESITLAATSLVGALQTPSRGGRLKF